MAAANSDQENVLLQSDEGSPSAPPPAGRLPFKARLAVGLCVFAAGLAGAVMMGRPAPRVPTNVWHRWSAPTKIWHRWSAIGLSEHEFKHMTKECVDLLDELEKEAEEQGRTHEAGSFSGGTLDCKEESEQACTMEVSMYGTDMTFAKCFPAVCKEDNIFKDMEASMADAPPEAELSGLEVSCAAPGEEDADFEAVGMTKECLDLLEALEKEAEEEGRMHQTDGYAGETLDCKEESEQACTFEFTMYGMNFTQGKCFPAVCKEENIFKTLEMGMACLQGSSIRESQWRHCHRGRESSPALHQGSDLLERRAQPPEAELSGLEVSCAAPGEEGFDGPNHMTKECVLLWHELMKEAEEKGRMLETDGYAGETLDCKKESEQACVFNYSRYGDNMVWSECFPAVCKEANILKDFQKHLVSDVPPEAQAEVELSVSCKSRAGQCGPEVGLLGASVLVVSIFAQ